MVFPGFDGARQLGCTGPGDSCRRRIDRLDRVERTAERFSEFQAQELSTERRGSILRSAEDHPVNGCGLGTIVHVYPRYETQYDGLIVDTVIITSRSEAHRKRSSFGGEYGRRFGRSDEITLDCSRESLH
jgi:hypothetical protein